MATVRKTITLTDRQDRWVKARVTAGGFTNDSEYIRDLIRRDQERSAGYRELEAAIREGIDSGTSDRTVTQIMDEAEARLRADGRL